MTGVFLGKTSTEGLTMLPEIRTVPWGSTIIKFPRGHFKDEDVRQAAQEVAPNFDAPDDCFVALQNIEAQTVGRVKGQPNVQFQAFHDDEVTALKMVLRQFVELLGKLYPKRP
jgi:hypothetical protein